MAAVKTGHEGIKSYYTSKIDELEIVVSEKTQDLRRLEAQRNELNSKGTSMGTNLTPRARAHFQKEWCPSFSRPLAFFN